MSGARDAVFLDASGLIALLFPDDSLHPMATHTMAILARTRASLVTSDWVLAEFLNSAAAARTRASAAEMARRTFANPGIDVVEAGRLGLLEALELYESRPDKDWSIVDCSSILICKERGIRRVFTHDRHFRQAGMQVLL